MKFSAAAFLTATMATSGIAEETLNAGDGCLQGTWMTFSDECGDWKGKHATLGAAGVSTMATCPDTDDDTVADTCFSLASPPTVATDDDREWSMNDDAPSPPDGCMLTWHCDGCVSNCEFVDVIALNVPWASDREDDGTDGVATCGAGSTAITAAALVGVAATLASLW
ncbi:hypothetical protein TeGR_g5577 [Tetraparma gracilis]|uniref:Uncharacterized protein n=1 Tax=Tetraparma gracilis TaxID=2962635 RepID=A0ABQ6MLR3_9STRA|nr:hypothetical protein TeGR_g5577 [Tetraparma gracilis]